MSEKTKEVVLDDFTKSGDNGKKPISPEQAKKPAAKSNAAKLQDGLKAIKPIIDDRKLAEFHVLVPRMMICKSAVSFPPDGTTIVETEEEKKAVLKRPKNDSGDFQKELRVLTHKEIADSQVYWAPKPKDWKEGDYEPIVYPPSGVFQAMDSVWKRWKDTAGKTKLPGSGLNNLTLPTEPLMNIMYDTKEMDIRTVYPPGSKSHVPMTAYRWIFYNAKFIYKCWFKPRLISFKYLIELIAEAGISEGFGAFGPRNKGPFGVAMVTKAGESLRALTYEEFVSVYAGSSPVPIESKAITLGPKIIKKAEDVPASEKEE